MLPKKHKIMKKLLLVVFILSFIKLNAQTHDSLFRWSMRFNKKCVIKDSCFPSKLCADTIFLAGRVNDDFDTLRFSYNDALFKDSWRGVDYSRKYFLEFRDGKDNLVDIESSLNKRWTYSTKRLPYINDSLAFDYWNIYVNIHSLFNDIGAYYPLLNVYFYKSGHKDKHKLCVLDFTTIGVEKKRK